MFFAVIAVVDGLSVKEAALVEWPSTRADITGTNMNPRSCHSIGFMTNFRFQELENERLALLWRPLTCD